jgi:hypothetical protein
MTRVIDLQVGDKIKIRATNVFVLSIQDNRVIVSKQQSGPYVFSVSKYSDKYEDLLNRVEMATGK